MSLKEQIDRDLKTAMLAGNKQVVTTLRGLKSALLYAEVDAGQREAGLSDTEAITILHKEAKKRQESIELYKQGGNQSKSDAELAELRIIEKYLPTQMSETELDKVVHQAINEIGELTAQTMGKVIGRAKELTKGRADGGRIAVAVKRRMT